MGLRLTDRWVWDFWIARDGPDYHLFYLQAERALVHEHLRHWHATIGHAVSSDLRHWEVLPDALAPSGPPAPGTPPAFDAYITWTGSIIRHAGLWYLFYTGCGDEQRQVQQIGLATSPDLLRWEKQSCQPLLVADPTWYEVLDPAAWYEQAWRDPWVMHDPSSGDFYAFITARAKDGPPDGRGVVGLARSADLLNWTVLPPVTEPGEFGHLEVPQVVALGGRYYLLFSVSASRHSAARQQRLAQPSLTGTHYLVADTLLGPYHTLTDEFLLGDAHGSFYSGKVVQAGDGEWQVMAVRSFTPQGEFLGEIGDPMPLAIQADGRLAVVDRDGE